MVTGSGYAAPMVSGNGSGAAGSSQIAKSRPTAVESCHIYWELIMYDFDLKKFFQVIYNHYEIDAGRKSLSSPDPGEICVPVQRRI